MKIEAGLADADDARMGGKRDEPVGEQRRRGPPPRADARRPSTRCAGRSRRSSSPPSNWSSRVQIVSIVPIPAAKARADHGIALRREIGKIEMAMAIDQHGGFDFQCSFRWVECLSFAANTANQQQTSVPY
jgi:hypothetical protein